VVAVVVAVVGAVALTSAAVQRKASRPASASAVARAVAEPLVPVSRAKASTPVEVPNVTGRTAYEAELILSCAGLVVASTGSSTTPDGKPASVISQSPSPGMRLAPGEQVSLVLAPPDPKRPRPLVVVLDPGHQAKADLSPEPLGPGSSETKEKATAGATGIETRQQECEVALEIATRVKTRLVASGVQVLLTRTTSAVDMSNKQRADMANRAGADLFVRIHADGGMTAEMHGVSVISPDPGGWTRGIAAPSKKAATAVDAALVHATHASDGGVSQRSDLAGFNWSKVPAILVEAGFLTNSAEDRLLANPGYQDKVADGIASGIMAYFGR
jgi:N-acetylmuramoyl-L-alanine amidase